ncbi:hypothetical protein ACFOEK_03415 [Litoribrevibacter euphylliae]|uniref:Uncharacterized protein n=1 Tax=Litoribrevibacter euphylliae TaxID=1834034 RepID=A0ABV7HD61_9GAMM
MEEKEILDVKVIVALIGVCGILITALLSSFGYLFKTRVETKKSARKVLYLLLEIRYAIINSLFDPEDAAKAYFEHLFKRIKEKGIPVEPSEIEGSMHDLVKTHFHNIISAMRTDIHENLLTPFEETLLDLATVKPVLAYRLRGKEKLEAVMSHTNNYLQSYEEKISEHIEQEWLQEVLFSSSDELKEENISELIALLDEDITLLAKHCGFIDYRECRQALQKKKIEPHEYDFSELDVFIDKILIKIIEAANKSIQPTASDVG